ncbi:TIGR01212 family radical SAM protein [Limisalsivibrio acetivorans]|uniref:TIGR01212 family radical SAM protein n=1 Tax=Limisalsivibrio acetivorans TaxID=1304888 RepID=UPI0003B54F3D|nr:TIGR01212 family radical SAM protein [Limisalsivibrio acetivorans]
MIYRSLNSYLRERFGEKTWKIPVEAGFTCPNRDGTSGTGGCIYCSNESFSGAEEGGIAEQVRSRIEKLEKKGINSFIVYFQSYSNTYGDLETVRSRIEESLIDERINAIHIGTRPDVVSDEILDYLAELDKRYEVVLELGLQSGNDRTLEWMNRGHGVREFIDTVERCRERGIGTCAHLILGLPGDTIADMRESARLVSDMGVHSVKFHHLHVVKGTPLAKLYAEGGLKLSTPEEYAEMLLECLAELHSDIVVSRLMGDAAGDTLIAPVWDISKNDFIQLLERLSRDKGLVQGSRC